MFNFILVELAYKSDFVTEKDSIDLYSLKR